MYNKNKRYNINLLSYKRYILFNNIDSINSINCLKKENLDRLTQFVKKTDPFFSKKIYNIYWSILLGKTIRIKNHETFNKYNKNHHFFVFFKKSFTHRIYRPLYINIKKKFTYYKNNNIFFTYKKKKNILYNNVTRTKEIYTTYINNKHDTASLLFLKKNNIILFQIYKKKYLWARKYFRWLYLKTNKKTFLPKLSKKQLKLFLHFYHKSRICFAYKDFKNTYNIYQWLKLIMKVIRKKSFIIASRYFLYIKKKNSLIRNILLTTSQIDNKLSNSYLNNSNVFYKKKNMFVRNTFNNFVSKSMFEYSNLIKLSRYKKRSYILLVLDLIRKVQHLNINNTLITSYLLRNLRKQQLNYKKKKITFNKNKYLLFTKNQLKKLVSLIYIKKKILLQTKFFKIKKYSFINIHKLRIKLYNKYNYAVTNTKLTRKIKNNDLKKKTIQYKLKDINTDNRIFNKQIHKKKVILRKNTTVLKKTKNINLTDSFSSTDDLIINEKKKPAKISAVEQLIQAMDKINDFANAAKKEPKKSQEDVISNIIKQIDSSRNINNETSVSNNNEQKKDIIRTKKKNNIHSKNTTIDNKNNNIDNNKTLNSKKIDIVTEKTFFKKNISDKKKLNDLKTNTNNTNKQTKQSITNYSNLNIKGYNIKSNKKIYTPKSIDPFIDFVRFEQYKLDSFLVEFDKEYRPSKNPNIGIYYYYNDEKINFKKIDRKKNKKNNNKKPSNTLNEKIIYNKKDFYNITHPNFLEREIDFVLDLEYVYNTKNSWRTWWNTKWSDLLIINLKKYNSIWDKFKYIRFLFIKKKFTILHNYSKYLPFITKNYYSMFSLINKNKNNRLDWGTILVENTYDYFYQLESYDYFSFFNINRYKDWFIYSVYEWFDSKKVQQNSTVKVSLYKKKIITIILNVITQIFSITNNKQIIEIETYLATNIDFNNFSLYNKSIKEIDLYLKNFLLTKYKKTNLYFLNTNSNECLVDKKKNVFNEHELLYFLKLKIKSRLLTLNRSYIFEIDSMFEEQYWLKNLSIDLLNELELIKNTIISKKTVLELKTMDFSKLFINPIIHEDHLHATRPEHFKLISFKKKKEGINRRKKKSRKNKKSKKQYKP